MDKLDFIKFYKFCLKGHFKQSETSNQRMGEIFTNNMSDKGFISRINTELII